LVIDWEILPHYPDCRVTIDAQKIPPPASVLRPPRKFRPPILRPPSSTKKFVLQSSGLRPPQKIPSSNPPASVLHKKFRHPILRPPSSEETPGLRPPLRRFGGIPPEDAHLCG